MSIEVICRGMCKNLKGKNYCKAYKQKVNPIKRGFCERFEAF